MAIPQTKNNIFIQFITTIATTTTTTVTIIKIIEEKMKEKNFPTEQTMQPNGKGKPFGWRLRALTAPHTRTIFWYLLEAIWSRIKNLFEKLLPIGVLGNRVRAERIHEYTNQRNGYMCVRDKCFVCTQHTQSVHIYYILSLAWDIMYLSASYAVQCTFVCSFRSDEMQNHIWK